MGYPVFTFHIVVSKKNVFNTVFFILCKKIPTVYLFQILSNQ